MLDAHPNNSPEFWSEFINKHAQREQAYIYICHDDEMLDKRQSLVAEILWLMNQAKERAENGASSDDSAADLSLTEIIETKNAELGELEQRMKGEDVSTKMPIHIPSDAEMEQIEHLRDKSSAEYDPKEWETQVLLLCLGLTREQMNDLRSALNSSTWKDIRESVFQHQAHRSRVLPFS